MTNTTIERATAMGSVSDVTRDFMRAVGMTTIFGNPGSTEMRFLKDWPSDFTYVMGLHEGASVAMADAYAQMTGNAAFVNLHSAGGVGNAMGLIYTAFRNQAPLVILAGQQTRAMMSHEPFLFSQDATLLPKPYVKWANEPVRAEDVPGAIARAYYMAMQRPWGPTLVSIPEDDWEKPTQAIAVRRIYSGIRPDPAAIEMLAGALNGATSPAFVIGAQADRDEASASIVRLAERVNARVWMSAAVGRCGFPENHPLFAGALPRSRSGAYENLRNHDVVVVIGAPIFAYHMHTEGPFIGEGTTVVQLIDDPAMASWAVAGDSIITSIEPAIEQLLLQVTASSRPALAPRVRPRFAPSDPISMGYALQSIADTLPDDAYVAEECPGIHATMHDILPLRAGSYVSSASGSLGYGLAAAVGSALGAPGRRIVAIIGDGSSMYAIQALWTAAQHGLPITYIILDNHGYGAMRTIARRQGAQHTPSFDIDGLDFVKISDGFGVPASRVERAADLVPALTQAYRSEGPVLLDVIVDRALPPLQP